MKKEIWNSSSTGQRSIRRKEMLWGLVCGEKTEGGSNRGTGLQKGCSTLGVEAKRFLCELPRGAEEGEKVPKRTSQVTSNATKSVWGHVIATGTYLRRCEHFVSHIIDVIQSDG